MPTLFIGHCGALYLQALRAPFGCSDRANGKAIGSIMKPTVNAVANQGALLNLKSAAFTVTDLAAFAELNVYAVNNAKFDWVISTSVLVGNAMGVSLPGTSFHYPIGDETTMVTYETASLPSSLWVMQLQT
ncbi:hypothetical protein EDD21DRAFT_358386 [Dissophora ornata]|nr:hypothetical protein EDD21DRAFT_358386 [Dissophora ornata]